MAETPVLEAVAREGVGKGAARSARREGFVPGVIYGGGSSPQTINVKFNTLLKQLKAGKFLSTLLNVKVDGQDNVVITPPVVRRAIRFVFWAVYQRFPSAPAVRAFGPSRSAGMAVAAATIAASAPEVCSILPW